MMVGSSSLNYESVPTEEGGPPRPMYRDPDGRPPFLSRHPAHSNSASFRKGKIITGLVIVFLLVAAIILGVGVAVARNRGGLNNVFGSPSADSFSQDGKKGGSDVDSWDSWEDNNVDPNNAIQDMMQPNEINQAPISPDDPQPTNYLLPDTIAKESLVPATTQTPSPPPTTTESTTPTPPPTTTPTSTTTSTPAPTTTPTTTTTTTTTPPPPPTTTTTTTPPPPVYIYTRPPPVYVEEVRPETHPSPVPANYPLNPESNPLRPDLGIETVKNGSLGSGNGTDSSEFNSDLGMVDYMVIMQKKVPVGVLLSILVFAILGSVSLLGAIIWILKRRNNKMRRRANVRRAIDELQEQDKSNLLNSDDEV